MKCFPRCYLWERNKIKSEYQTCTSNICRKQNNPVFWEYFIISDFFPPLYIKLSHNSIKNTIWLTRTLVFVLPVACGCQVHCALFMLLYAPDNCCSYILIKKNLILNVNIPGNMDDIYKFITFTLDTMR